MAKEVGSQNLVIPEERGREHSQKEVRDSFRCVRVFRKCRTEKYHLISTKVGTFSESGFRQVCREPLELRQLAAGGKQDVRKQKNLVVGVLSRN